MHPEEVDEVVPELGDDEIIGGDFEVVLFDVPGRRPLQSLALTSAIRCAQLETEKISQE